jgi:hypothetical protein
MATQVVVAGSAPVLTAALPHISPAMSLQALKNNIQVSNPAGAIISISASGKTAAQAEDTANAVANSYVSYLTSSKNPVGYVSANVLEYATTASGTKLPEAIGIYGLLGLLGGVIVGLIVALAIKSNERRLRDRDAIANSVGAPVLASLSVSHPSDAVSWAKLLTDYEPDPKATLGLTQLLRQVDPRNGGAASVTVLSLVSDPHALALGPQLAAFAAAQGIPTALILGPQQDNNVTATLRTACAAFGSSAGKREQRNLQVLVLEDGRLERLPTGFVVVVAVIDGKAPVMPQTVHTGATVLGVSAGGATAEQLARAATAAAGDGRDIVGFLIADPDPDDQSTGRIPRLMRPLQPKMPTRVSDIPTEIKR